MKIGKLNEDTIKIVYKKKKFYEVLKILTKNGIEILEKIANNSDSYETHDTHIEETKEKDYIPIMTKEGYYTIPKYEDLIMMNEKQLRGVEHFTIYNEHGMIEFEGPSDITYQNLDNIVYINEEMVKK